jgi:hypothetical protein
MTSSYVSALPFAGLIMYRVYVIDSVVRWYLYVCVHVCVYVYVCYVCVYMYVCYVCVYMYVCL